MDTNQNTPLVSIGLPVYNGADYLKSTIDSILAQTFKDFELIISDNASNDATQQICEEYAAKDHRIIYIRNQENVGAIQNYLNLLEASRGKYFKWAGHDDLLKPKLIEKLVEALENNPEFVLSYSRTTRINGEGEVITDNYKDELDITLDTPSKRFKAYNDRFKENTMCDPIFSLYRKEVLDKTIPLGTYMGCDAVFLGELVMHGKFFEVPESLFLRRIHDKMFGQATKSLKDKLSWFDPSNKNKMKTKRIPMLVGFWNSVSNVDMNSREKLLSYFEVIKWGLRHYRGLSVDVLLLLRQSLNKLFS